MEGVGRPLRGVLIPLLRCLFITWIVGLSRAYLGHGPDPHEIRLSFSSSFWNFVHKSNVILDDKGVVIDITDLLVPSGRARHADVVSVPGVDASYGTRVECIVVGHFPDESGVHPILNVVEAVVTSHNSLAVLDQLIAQA